MRFPRPSRAGLAIAAILGVACLAGFADLALAQTAAPAAAASRASALSRRHNRTITRLRVPRPSSPRPRNTSAHPNRLMPAM